MSAALQMALALGSVAVLLGLMAVVRHLAGLWQIGAEVQRKMVHIGTGLYALVLPWLFPDRWPVYVLVALTLGVMLVLRTPGSKLGGTLHGVGRQSHGDFLLAISVGLCLFLAQDQLYLYVLPIAVLTLADAAAALAGSTYGRRFFVVEDGQKSVEGSAVFFAVTLVISFVCLLLMTPFAPANIIVVSLMVAAFGTLVEAQSWRGFDNLFLPLGLLIFLSVHAGDALPDLLLLAAFFALCSLAFRIVSRRIGLEAHTARVFVISVFLLFAMTDVQNTVFPIAVLAAHVWCRRASPCNARFPDLDLVAGLALVSFFWLTLGTATGWGAISFYGLTAMAMMVGLCALALAPQSVWGRVAGVCIIVVTSCALRLWLLGFNPAASNWNGPMWPAVAASVTVVAMATLLRPQAFADGRALKITLLALVVPLGAYLMAVGFWEVSA